MKLLTGKQIKEWDQFTIKNEPISSLDLMERASLSFVQWFVSNYKDTSIPILIFCGNGNNGGDGLAIARLLRDRFYEVRVFIFKFANSDTTDFTENLHRLEGLGDVEVNFIENLMPKIQPSGIIVDALLGTGINKPVDGFLKDIIMEINQLMNTKISIDIPSGLPSEGEAIGASICADVTFTFQIPKQSFFLRSNYMYCPKWIVGDIGLLPRYLDELETEVFFIDSKEISNIYKFRTKYQHKGNFGHAVIIAGSKGKIGASLLTTKACLRSGVGLVTAYIPAIGQNALINFVPEAMSCISGDDCFDVLDLDLSTFTIGIGPGLGMAEKTIEAFENLLKNNKQPMVIDADAINIIALNRDLLEIIPPYSIITPHPKEFERLFGRTETDVVKFDLARTMAIKHKLHMVLKGAHTRIFTACGKEYINSTGNPGMATAGSGDVLTGIITALLAQGYDPKNAAILGVYVHGLAGDTALITQSYESLCASDIIDHLGAAFKSVAGFA